MTFQQCIIECAKNKNFVAEFDRLTGTNLQLNGTPIELMIDKATGKQAGDLWRFVEFVDEWVWMPLVSEGKLG